MCINYNKVRKLREINNSFEYFKLANNCISRKYLIKLNNIKRKTFFFLIKTKEYLQSTHSNSYSNREKYYDLDFANKSQNAYYFLPRRSIYVLSNRTI